MAVSFHKASKNGICAKPSLTLVSAWNVESKLVLMTNSWFEAEIFTEGSGVDKKLIRPTFRRLKKQFILLK